MRSTYLIIYVALCSFMFASCGESKVDDRRTVCVTIEPLRMFTETIAGDRFEVVSIVPSGSSPETYDPAPQQLITLAHSEAYFMAGYLGFELNWIDNLKENNPDLPFFDTSVGIDLLQLESGVDGLSSPAIMNDSGHGGHNHVGGVEPHVWNSAKNALIIADNICRGLSEIDPMNAEEYTHHTDSLKQVIRQTDAQIRKLISDTSASFLIYHPALSYFARDYGLHQISIEENGKEPSPSQLQHLIEQCREENVKVIFVQQEFDVRNAELIAKELGVEAIRINPLSYDWSEEMIRIANAIK